MVLVPGEVDGLKIRFLLADRSQELLTVYIDGFRTYETLEMYDAFDECVVHHDGALAAEKE